MLRVVGLWGLLQYGVGDSERLQDEPGVWGNKCLEIDYVHADGGELGWVRGD